MPRWTGLGAEGEGLSIGELTTRRCSVNWEKMDSAAVQRQVEHMTRFFLAEARERVLEIETDAEEQFCIEHAMLVERAVATISSEFERKRNQAEVASKMYVSRVTCARRHLPLPPLTSTDAYHQNQALLCDYTWCTRIAMSVFVPCRVWVVLAWDFGL